MTADMHLPEVVSPEEWLAARKDLLVKEEEASLVRHPLFAAVVGAVLGAVLTNPGAMGPCSGDRPPPIEPSPLTPIHQLPRG